MRFKHYNSVVINYRLSEGGGNIESSGKTTVTSFVAKCLISVFLNILGNKSSSLWFYLTRISSNYLEMNG